MAQIVSTEGVNRAASAFLLGVCVVQMIASIRTTKVEENAIGAAVCLIAFLHYLWMQGANSTTMQELRYSDWIVTCPLLLWELHKMSGQETKKSLGWPVVSVIAMLIFGFFSEASLDPKSRKKMFIGGCVAFAACILSFLPHVKQNHTLVYAFFVIWSLYPFASWYKNNAMLSMLDMLSKGGFGLYIATNAMNNMS